VAEEQRAHPERYRGEGADACRWNPPG
jgi:hypothetical protein